MSSTSWLPALRIAGRRQALSASSLRMRTRCFSTTQSNNVRAVFGDSSNPDLGDILDQIQKNITLPAYLPEAQRELVFDPKKKNYIEQNPVVIEIEGLEYKFPSINVHKDIPNSKKAFRTAIRAMRTEQDFANLETLLAGYKKAGIVLKAADHGKMARQARLHRQVPSILHCARHANDTGFKLAVSESSIVTLSAIATEARDGDANKAARWLNEVVDIINRRPHTGISSSKQLQKSPMARGLMLYTRLMAATSQNADDRHKVALADEVEAMRHLWQKELARDSTDSPETANERLGLLPGLFKLKSTNAKARANKEYQKSGGLTPSYFVQVYAENIKALEGAAEFVAKDCEPFGQVAKQLESHLHKQVEQLAKIDDTLASRLPTYAALFQDITGRAPAWAEPSSEGWVNKAYEGVKEEQHLVKEVIDGETVFEEAPQEDSAEGVKEEEVKEEKGL